MTTVRAPAGLEERRRRIVQSAQTSTIHTRRVGRRMARSGRRERGAVIVEFALLAPIFFAVLFGIIEFGWAFGQSLDVRHAAREAARLTAVNWPSDASSGVTQMNAIAAEVCGRLNLAEGATVTFTDLGAGTPGSSPDAGQTFRIRVAAPFEQITGFFDWILGGVTISSTVDARMEVDGTWSNGGTYTAPACA